MATYGYARVSTDGQSLQSQTQALHAAHCERIPASGGQKAHGVGYRT